MAKKNKFELALTYLSVECEEEKAECNCSDKCKICWINTCKESVKKNIARKPEKKMKSFHLEFLGKTVEQEIYCCPYCGNPVMLSNVKLNHCNDCSQAIDWKGAE